MAHEAPNITRMNEEVLEKQERRRSQEVFCCCGFCFVFAVGFFVCLWGVAFDFVCLIAYFELLPYVVGQGRDEERTGEQEGEWNWGAWCETPKESVKKLFLKKVSLNTIAYPRSPFFLNSSGPSPMLFFIQGLQPQVGTGIPMLCASKGHPATNLHQSDQNTEEHQYKKRGQKAVRGSSG